jgi:hypothetical protein
LVAFASRVYAGDHDGSVTPHVHAHFPEGDIVIEMYSDNSVALSTAHRMPVDPGIKRPQIKRALIAGAETRALLELWEESRIK